ncbi:MAG TPA: 3-deoxy-manno-octulosonate cytidylyltransferase [Candidatus Acidoferrales bacterium]|nr:3-deoxy-manno-octulosonate cytidylyltransferase [Candidatus Acidoferrales bacterium]
MTISFSAIAIIPARLASTRLPRKVLREISGQPMIARVYEAAKQSPLLQDVIIATDSEEVMQFAQARGWKAQITSDKHRSGTDRVYEVAQRIAADVYVNIQGDEPLARSEHLDALLKPMQDARVMVSTIKTPCPPQDVDNPNAVKVVTDLNGRALYFSRSTIPFDRDKTGVVTYFKHLGFYAYRREALDKFCNLPESKLEAAERLEQLRFLDNGIDIYVAETPFNTVGVDTEEDLRRVEEMVRASGK